VTVTRTASWATLDEKAAWLDAAASTDTGRPGCRALAARIFGASGGDPAKCVGVAFAFWRDEIRYERDRRLADMKRAEQFADTDTILRRGSDDCDGKSRGFVATLRALAQLGVDCDGRIVPVFSADFSDFKHVQAHARWRGSAAFPRAEPDGWVLAELTLKGVPLGAGVEAATRNATTGRLDVT
jgi:hypothetical protein